jgi:hypothetical protein
MLPGYPLFVGRLCLSGIQRLVDLLTHVRTSFWRNTANGALLTAGRPDGLSGAFPVWHTIRFANDLADDELTGTCNACQYLIHDLLTELRNNDTVHLLLTVKILRSTGGG